ncbi:MAG: hypothetical protein K8T89_17330 [Planctomycetes bacterium]|nr:hypothetical protein [Planctomycetota bacterium]
MTSVATIPAGDNLLLLPPRESPYLLQDVYELVRDTCRTEIVLQWAEDYLLFHADEDTDSIGFELHPGEFSPTSHHGSYRADEGLTAPWKKFIGKECGWTWVAHNQQGYCDSVMLSFDGIVPTLLLHVIASSIEVFSINAAQEPLKVGV